MRLYDCKYNRINMNDLYTDIDDAGAAILRKLLSKPGENKNHSAFI